MTASLQVGLRPWSFRPVLGAPDTAPRSALCVPRGKDLQSGLSKTTGRLGRRGHKAVSEASFCLAGPLPVTSESRPPVFKMVRQRLLKIFQTFLFASFTILRLGRWLAVGGFGCLRVFGFCSAFIINQVASARRRREPYD